MFTCPVCTHEMRRRRGNIYICDECEYELEQMTIDYVENKERQKLIAARLKAGFETVHEAANASGYNASYLRGLERGAHPFTPKTAGRLAAAYGCGISDLVD